RRRLGAHRRPLSRGADQPRRPVAPVLDRPLPGPRAAGGRPAAVHREAGDRRHLLGADAARNAAVTALSRLRVRAKKAMSQGLVLPRLEGIVPKARGRTDAEMADATPGRGVRARMGL